MKIEPGRVYLIAWGLWLLVLPSFSQKLDTASWLEGQIVTINRDTLPGKIHVSREFLQILSGQVFRVFDPSQVKGYTVLDPDLLVPRTFARYESEGFVRPEFYEQLIVGPIHYIRQISEFYFYTYEPNYLKAGSNDDLWVPRKRQGLQGTYFLWDGVRLYKVGSFKGLIKKLSGKHWQHLAEFARENHLNYGKPGHQARIVNLYNQLYYRDQVSLN